MNLCNGYNLTVSHDTQLAFFQNTILRNIFPPIFFSPEFVAATNDRKLKLIEIDYHDCKNRSVRLPKKLFSGLCEKEDLVSSNVSWSKVSGKLIDCEDMPHNL